MCRAHSQQDVQARTHVNYLVLQTILGEALLHRLPWAQLLPGLACAQKRLAVHIMVYFLQALPLERLARSQSASPSCAFGYLFFSLCSKSKDSLPDGRSWGARLFWLVLRTSCRRLHTKDAGSGSSLSDAFGSRNAMLQTGNITNSCCQT